MTPVLRYLLSLGAGLAVTGFSFLVVLDLSASGLKAEAAPVAAVQRVAEVAPTTPRVLTQSDFDISKLVEVRVTGRTPDMLPGHVASKDAPVEANRATVTADAVNVRAAASVRSNKIGVVRAGTKVEVVAEERSWSRIVAEDGTSGWLASKFLSRTN